MGDSVVEPWLPGEAAVVKPQGMRGAAAVEPQEVVEGGTVVELGGPGESCC